MPHAHPPRRRALLCIVRRLTNSPTWTPRPGRANSNCRPCNRAIFIWRHGFSASSPERPWQTRWSHGYRVTDHQTLTGHTGPVNAVTSSTLPDGTPVLISAGADGTMRIWRLTDGTSLGPPLTGHTDGVLALTASTLPDGSSVIVSGGADGTVRVWRLADGIPIGQPMVGHDGEVHAVAALALPDGNSVIVSGGADGTVRVWRLADGTCLGSPLTDHTAAVQAVDCAEIWEGGADYRQRRCRFRQWRDSDVVSGRPGSAWERDVGRRRPTIYAFCSRMA